MAELIMFDTLRNVTRLTKIAYVLARHKALFPLEMLGLSPLLMVIVRLIPGSSKGRDGERLAAALEELGPTFIKLGQALSTRADLMGEAVAGDLARLQDKVPPFPYARVEQIIQQEFDAPLALLFESIEEEAIAAASIAQVHQAVTVEGQKVAVKILRPGIEKAFARDIKLFYWLAHLVERNMPSLKRLKPVEVIHTFVQTVKLEMDFRFEAAAASELKENCAGDQGFYVPEIDWQRTSKRVLTLEWVEGIPILDREALIAAGHDPKKIAERLAVSFFNQAYRDGFFHADMHPGNLFVNNKGDIVAVDFGIMGRLDRQTRLYVAEILRGFLMRDYHYVAQVHFDAGYVPKHHSVALFAQACRSIGEPIVGLPVNKISIARLLMQLFKITEDFDMETQPQLLLLQKTMMLVEGVGYGLDPEVNMWKLAEPWIEEWGIRNLGPEAKLRDMARGVGALLMELPRVIEHVLRNLR
jgi:ubiquinone biosynthesis protein